MGEPRDTCERQKSPFINYTSLSTPSVDTSVLTTTTTTTPEPEFFLLPVSGIPCPETIFTQDNGIIDPVPPLDNPKVYYTCNYDLTVPSPCVIESDKYIRVADIVVDVDSCKSYKLTLSEVE